MIKYKVTQEMADSLSPFIQQCLTAGYLRGWSTSKTFQHVAKENNMKNGYSKLMSVYRYMIENNMKTTVIG
jgi:hypothetical protein